MAPPFFTHPELAPGRVAYLVPRTLSVSICAPIVLITIDRVRYPG